MKNSYFKKLVMAFALIIFIQNGSIIIQDTTQDNGAYTEEESGISPLSDKPYTNDNYT